jgi:hypothetical protein
MYVPAVFAKIYSRTDVNLGHSRSLRKSCTYHIGIEISNSVVYLFQLFRRELISTDNDDAFVIRHEDSAIRFFSGCGRPEAKYCSLGLKDCNNARRRLRRAPDARLGHQQHVCLHQIPLPNTPSSRQLESVQSRSLSRSTTFNASNSQPYLPPSSATFRNLLCLIHGILWFFPIVTSLTGEALESGYCAQIAHLPERISHQHLGLSLALALQASKLGASNFKLQGFNMKTVSVPCACLIYLATACKLLSIFSSSLPLTHRSFQI